MRHRINGGPPFHFTASGRVYGRRIELAAEAEVAQLFGDLGQTYAVPWAIVTTQYSAPAGMILAIPLDDQYPWPNMLTRRFDGGDDRILAYDAELGQWRHVPDPATFQARGYDRCNATAADAGFFNRITLGPPYPASSVPPRADHTACQT